MLNAGADKVSINTAAVNDPGFVAAAAGRFGSQAIVVAIDARRADGGSGWEIYTHGGRRPTGIDAIEWAAKMADLGAGEILLTSMDRDGTREGFDLALTRAVVDAVPVPVIASGGVGCLAPALVARPSSEAVEPSPIAADGGDPVFGNGRPVGPRCARQLAAMAWPTRDRRGASGKPAD